MRCEDADSPTSSLRLRVALLLCGEFNPPNYAHLRVFERTRDYLERVRGWQVVEGAMSASRDRPGLVAVKHRLRMLQACLADSTWVRASTWESSQKTEAGIVHVLREYQAAVRNRWGQDIRVIFLCGSDYFAFFGRHAHSRSLSADNDCGNHSFERFHDFASAHTNPLFELSKPHKHGGDCSESGSLLNVKEILSDYGVIVLVRRHSDPDETIYESDLLRQFQGNIHVLHDETFPNELSSMRLRVALRRRESIRYCTPDRVIEYIAKHRLYAPTIEHLPDCVYYKSLTEREREEEKDKEVTRMQQQREVQPKASSQRPTTSPPPQPPLRSSSVQPSFHPLTSLIGSRHSELTSTLPPSSGHAISTSHTRLPLKMVWKEKSESQRPLSGQDDPLPTPPPPFVPPPPTTMKEVKATSSIVTTANKEAEGSRDDGKKNEMTRCMSIVRPLGSPSYDNVTLEELLAASTCWAEYMSEQCKKFRAEESPIAEEDLILSTTAGRAASEKRGLYSCGGRKEGRSESEAWGLKGLMNGQRNGAKDSTKTVRVETPKSARDRDRQKVLQQAKTVDDLALVENNNRSKGQVVMSKSLYTTKSDEEDAEVYLTFRQYRLTATPETTV